MNFTITNTSTGRKYMIERELIFTKSQYDKYYDERFIYGKELLEIAEIMKKCSNYRILITGAPGSGKSTLLHRLSHYTANKNPIEIIYGYNIRNNRLSIEQKVNPLFIDGLDEIESAYEFLQLFSIKSNDKIVCTSRTTIPFDTYFTHIITLNPMTQLQIQELLNKVGLDNRLFHSLISNQHINPKEITPKDILSFAFSYVNNSDIQEFYTKYNNLLYQYGSGVDFSSDVILPNKNIIVPSKDIVKGVTVINDTLLKRAKENPQIMHNFTPREFEEMVCELLDKQGHNVKLTKQTRDGGKDVIVVQKSILGEFCIYVECKKYDKSNPISVSLVRELYGTITADTVTAGMIITTSYFTKDAKEYTDKIKHRMTLRDYNDLVQELNTI